MHEQLENFFNRHPHIRYVTPSSPDSAELRSIWYGSEGPTPLGITRPRTAEDVASIVSFAVSHGVPFTVRSGGHDSWYRGFAADALAIDMRDIDFVHLNADRKSARIGGGVLQGKIAQELAEEGLATSLSSVPSIGYVGWVVCGGYGRFAGTYGMGVDQILAAKIVNCEGKLVEANDEMLKIIRGAGGMLGVIVELTIKVYSLKKILAGRIAYESSDLATTVKRFAAGYRALEVEGSPAALHLLPVITNSPSGKMLSVALTWSSSDFVTGRKFANRVASFGSTVAVSIEETTIPDWMDKSSAVLPTRMFGIHNQKSCRVYKLTEEVAEVIAEAALQMPNDPAALTGIHSLRNAEQPIKDSVFKARKPHFLIEALPTLSEPDVERIEQARKWAEEYMKALERTNRKNLEPAQYFTHTSPDDANFPEMYEEHWEMLVQAKKEYDPQNVFRSGPVFE